MNFNRCSRCGGFFMAEGDTCPNCLQRDKFEMNRLENFIEERKQARIDKNFKRSDEIRDELLAEGIILEDGKEGTRWKLKK